MPHTAIIIAVGSHTHESALIYNRPRTMLPALGKPLVVRIMNRLYRSGIRDYVVILGEKEGNVANHINQKWVSDANIEYILKRDTVPLGRILSQIANEHPHPMLVVSYNDFTHAHLSDRLLKYHQISPDDLILAGSQESLSASQQHRYASLPAITGKPIQDPSSQLAADSIVLLAKTPTPNTPNLILGDTAMWGRRFVAFLAEAPEATCRRHNLFDIAADYFALDHVVRVARTSWTLKVQTDQDLLTLNRHLLTEETDAHILSELPYTVHIRPPVRIDPGVNVGQGATIGPYVYLEKGSSVGRQAHVRNTIVLENCFIEASASVENTIVSSRKHHQFS